MPVREVLFYEFDDFRLDVKRQELLRDGYPVSLTHKAFQVLLILVQNFGQTINKEDIYKHLWANSFVEDANLTQYIYILRKTLGRNSAGELYIETVARFGYQFAADVNALYAPAVVAESDAALDQQHFADEIGEPTFLKGTPSKPYLTLIKNAAEISPHSDSPLDTDQSIPPDPQGRVVRPNRNVVWAALLFTLTVAAAIGIFYYALRQPENRLGNGKNRSIAILPFEQIGEESRNEKLGLGMADAIITRLGKLREIPVRPTSAVFRYTDQMPVNSSVAGVEMGVDTVLEGTVQREDGRIRVSVRLMNVSDGKTLWADNFDENFTDIFSVQDLISSKVVRALEINLTPQQEYSLSDHSTGNTEAFQAFQAGVYFGSSRTKEGLEKAADYFQKAIADDPNYARAYAMLADTYNMLGYYHFADGPETVKKASAAAEKALALDEKVPEGHIALAFLKLSEKDGQAQAKAALERAIELAPFNSTARVRYGWLLLNGKDLDGSVQQMRLAQEYDPLSPVSNTALCEVLDYQGDYNGAIKYCEKSVEMAPSLFNAKLALAESYFVAGRQNEAIALVEKEIPTAENIDRYTGLGSLGYFYAKQGRTSEANKIISDLRSHAVKDPSLLIDLTVISYAMGNNDDGFAYFQQAYRSHAVHELTFLYNPMWDAVKADSRVMKLMGNS
ncbi:MAG: winged helix-turn-helix domain-containing protein [Acidobacteriota bacterium]